MGRQNEVGWSVSNLAGDMTLYEIDMLKMQLKAVVPALVELCDAGYIDITMKIIADSCTLDGLMQLAGDVRLSEPSRCRCEVMRDHMISHDLSSFNSGNFFAIGHA